MEKKVLVMIHLRDTWNDVLPLQDSPKTRESFQEFFTFIRSRGVEPYRASIHWYNLEGGFFEKAWTFDGTRWVKLQGPIVPTFIFDKVSGRHDYALFDLKMKMSEKAVVFNSPLFRSLLDNKLSQYVIFQKFMPLSFVAHNTANLSSIFKNIPSEKVVLKPLYGSGGQGILICEKNAINGEALRFPLLVQTFLATGGVPGVSPKDEVADLRLVYVNHRVIYALSRIAKEGSLFTNFHQGATARIVPIEHIPPRCVAMAKEIVTVLSTFPSVNYSLDFMFSKNGDPTLIEMNTTPGFDLLLLVGTAELREKYFSELLSSAGN